MLDISDVLLLVLTAIVNIPIIVYYDQIKNQLKSSKDRQRLITQLNRHRLSKYYIRLLIATLKWFRRSNGFEFSTRSFGLCYSISLAYVSISALLSWNSSSDLRLGDVIISGKTIWVPTWISNTSILWLIPGYVIIYGVVPFWVYRKFGNELQRSFQVTKKNVLATVYILSITVWIAFWVAGPVAGTAALSLVFLIVVIRYGVSNGAILGCLMIMFFGGNLAGIISPYVDSIDGVEVASNAIGILATFTMVLSLMKIGSRYGPFLAFSCAFMSIGFLALVFRVSQRGSLLRISDETIIEIILFFLALPMFNAFFDYISLGVSLVLCKHIVRRCRYNVSRAIWYGVFDTILAITLSLAIIIGVPVVLKVVEILIGHDLGVRIFITSSVTNLWVTGRWFGTMIFSTVFWTFVHLAIVIVTLIVRFIDLWPLDKWVRSQIASNRNDYWVKVLLTGRYLIVTTVCCGIIFGVAFSLRHIAYYLFDFFGFRHIDPVDVLEQLGHFGLELFFD